MNVHGEVALHCSDFFVRFGVCDGSRADRDEPAFFDPTVYKFLVAKVRILFVDLLPCPDSFLYPIALFATAGALVVSSSSF